MCLIPQMRSNSPDAHVAGCLQDKKVADVMTPITRCFMLEASLCLDYEIMLQIYKSGYTRIPVYEGCSSPRIANVPAEHVTDTSENKYQSSGIVMC